MSGNDEAKTAAEIERDVEETRERVSEKLDDLMERVTTPKHVAEDLTAMAGGGSDMVVRVVGAALKENPLPVLLIGAGLAWMLAGDRTQPAARPSHAEDGIARAGASTRAEVDPGTAVRARPHQQPSGSRESLVTGALGLAIGVVIGLSLTRPVRTPSPAKARHRSSA